jgi:hypothetical protein
MEPGRKVGDFRARSKAASLATSVGPRSTRGLISPAVNKSAVGMNLSTCPPASILYVRRFEYHQALVLLGMAVLDSEFKKQRAQTARDLAAIAIDRFTKKRLLDLAARYEGNNVPARTQTTPVDLEVKSPGKGSER